MLARIIAVAFFCAGVARAQNLHRWPVSGGVTDSSATVAVWLDSAASVRIEYSAQQNFAAAQSTGPYYALAATDFTVQAELKKLAPSTRYYYRVRKIGTGPPATDTVISPAQSFKTFPKTGKDAPVTLMFGSCQQVTASDQGKVFTAAGAMDADVFLQTGDWSYPTARVPGYPLKAGALRDSYSMRLDTAYPFAAQVLRRMPVCYVWDDNDHYKSNGDGNIDSTLKRGLIDAYRQYIPHYPLANAQNGIWHAFSIANADVFMTDSRSQRRPVNEAFTNNTFSPPPGHSMLAGYPVTGTDQRRWLDSAIRASKARWKILVTPVYFNPATKQIIDLSLQLGELAVAQEAADKWVGYPEDVDMIRNLLKDGYGRNLVILSGDAHVNVYDDGTHSLAPEFMAGNLDNLAATDPFALLSALGINVWTRRLQPNRRTVGRLQVQTLPVHKLIIESFDESGNTGLTLQINDASSGVDAPVAGGVAGSVTASAANGMLALHYPAMAGRASYVKLYDVLGRPVLHDVIVFNAAGVARVALPRSVRSGLYVGALGDEGASGLFRFMIFD